LLREFDVPGFATLSLDGSNIIFMDDKELVWQTLKGVRIRRISLTSSQFRDCSGRLELSHDGSKILSQGSRVACLVDSRDGTIRTIRPSGSAAITNTSLSNDGKKVAIANFRNVVSIYDVSSRDYMPVRILVGHTGPVDNVRFGSDGSTLITASSRDGTIRLWGRDGALIHVIRTGSTVSAIDISPDYKNLLSASSNTLTAWDLDMNRLLKLGCERLRNYLNSPSTNLGHEERRLCQR
jgi:WD40 repeat protein